MRINQVKLRMERARYALTKTAFAEKCGLARKTVIKAEIHGHCSRTTAALMAETLGLKLEDLMATEELESERATLVG